MAPITFEFPDPVKASTFAAIVASMDLGHTAKASHRVVDVTLATSTDPAFLRGARDLLVLSADCHGGRVEVDPFAPGRTRLPRGFRRGHSDDLACAHRDVSCCPACAKAHPEILEIYGQHFWMPDAYEREALRAEMAEPEGVLS